MALLQPRIQEPQVYVASLRLTPTARAMLSVVTARRLGGQNCTLSVRHWAALLKRSIRQVIRASGELRRWDLMRRIRRGRGLTNIYLLAYRLWCRMTGRPLRRLDPEVQGLLWRLGKRAAVPEQVMARMRVCAPSSGA